MKVEINKVTNETLEAIHTATLSKESVEVTLFTLSREDEDAINRILSTFLNAHNQEHLFSYLSYCTLELLANAKKANAKRIYFQEKGLNILDEKDYKNGMLTFNTELTVHKDHYCNLLQTQNIFITLTLVIEDNNVIVQVTNKAEITEIEFQRINEKMESAKIYNSMEEALTDIDRTEGSGLGIIIIVLMLKQLGLDRENLSFATGNGTTTVRIKIPLDTIEQL